MIEYNYGHSGQTHRRIYYFTNQQILYYPHT